MVNSGTFDSDVDRNEKDGFTQSDRVAESPQSVISIHIGSQSLCENDFATQTADSLPVSQAIEPTATKTEYKCNMSEMDIRKDRTLKIKYDSNESAKETCITAEGLIEGCLNKNPLENGTVELIEKDIKSKPSICCSVPLEKVRDVLKTYTKFRNTQIQPAKQVGQKYMCLYCDRTFLTVSLKQKHVDRFHSLKHNRRLSARRQAAKLCENVCMFCNKLNNAEYTLKQVFEHFLSEHSNKYFGCLNCELRFPNTLSLENHNTKVHNFSNNKSLDLSDLNLSDRKIENLERKIFDEVPVQNVVIENHVLQTENCPILSEIDTVEQKTRNRLKLKYASVNNDLQEEKYSSSVPFGPESTDKLPENRLNDDENKLNLKNKSKTTWIKDLRNKKIGVVSTKAGIKQGIRITRQQNKTAENVKTTKRKLTSTKINHNANTNNLTKYYPYQNGNFLPFDVNFRIKKITDHSIDNLRINTMTFDDVFDKAFFNRVKCNIQENLQNFIDGKLFKSLESENRILSFQKSKDLAVEELSQSYGCKISSNAVTPVAAALLTTQFGEDLESQIEYGSKPCKKKSNAVLNDEVHYKYFTRRKYQAVISESKDNRDLSKLDMWTQLAIKNRQQKIQSEKKSDKEILEYKRSDEYKVQMQVEELNNILDKRGPLEDLKEEAIRTVALEKLNSTTSEANIDTYFDVTIILNELLNSLLPTQSYVSVVDNRSNDSLSNAEDCSENTIQNYEIPNILNLRRISPPSVDKPETKCEIEKEAVLELTGEWARSRIYVCAACGLKVPNAKLLMDHKNLYHENVWCQHYEFVGNQGELYRHLSIPGLGKIGAVEDQEGSSFWRRSDARMCSKCNKRFNCLGDLHRHILECGGDWSWMLARKKYKYRPYGAKPRKKRKGLLRYLHIFRGRNRDQSREKRKTNKKFTGPRPKASDADSIERMLANLPAKRITRKVHSLKDGLQRVMKNKKIIKKNKNNKIKTQNLQISAAGNTEHRNYPKRKYRKRSQRVLRSNSMVRLENTVNLILPKFKSDKKKDIDKTNSNATNISKRRTKKTMQNKPTNENDLNTNFNNIEITEANSSSSPDITTPTILDDNDQNTTPKLKSNGSLKKRKTKLKQTETKKGTLGNVKANSQESISDKAPDLVNSKEVILDDVINLEPPTLTAEVDLPLISKHSKKFKRISKKEGGDEKLYLYKHNCKLKIPKITRKTSLKINNGETDISPSSIEAAINDSNTNKLNNKSNELPKKVGRKKKQQTSDQIKEKLILDKINEISVYDFDVTETNLPPLLSALQISKNRRPRIVKKSDLNATTTIRRKRNYKNKTQSNKVPRRRGRIPKIIQVDGSSQIQPTKNRSLKKEQDTLSFLDEEPLLENDLCKPIVTSLTTNNEILEPSEAPESSVTPDISPTIQIDNSEIIENNVHNDFEMIQEKSSHNTLTTPVIEEISQHCKIECEFKLEVSSENIGKENVAKPAVRKKTKKTRDLNDCIAMLTNKLQDKALSQASQGSAATIFDLKDPTTGAACESSFSSNCNVSQSSISIINNSTDSILTSLNENVEFSSSLVHDSMNLTSSITPFDYSTQLNNLRTIESTNIELPIDLSISGTEAIEQSVEIELGNYDQITDAVIKENLSKNSLIDVPLENKENINSKATENEAKEPDTYDDNEIFSSNMNENSYLSNATKLSEDLPDLDSSVSNSKDILYDSNILEINLPKDFTDTLRENSPEIVDCAYKEHKDEKYDLLLNETSLTHNEQNEFNDEINDSCSDFFQIYSNTACLDETERDDVDDSNKFINDVIDNLRSCSRQDVLPECSEEFRKESITANLNNITDSNDIYDADDDIPLSQLVQKCMSNNISTTFTEIQQDAHCKNLNIIDTIFQGESTTLHDTPITSDTNATSLDFSKAKTLTSTKKNQLKKRKTRTKRQIKTKTNNAYVKNNVPVLNENDHQNAIDMYTNEEPIPQEIVEGLDCVINDENITKYNFNNSGLFSDSGISVAEESHINFEDKELSSLNCDAVVSEFEVLQNYKENKKPKTPNIDSNENNTFSIINNLDDTLNKSKGFQKEIWKETAMKDRNRPSNKVTEKVTPLPNNKSNKQPKTVGRKRVVKVKTKPQIKETNNFCNICNKTFKTNDNLLKHMVTLTHIAKLSQLEAFQTNNKILSDCTEIENDENKSIANDKDDLKENISTNITLNDNEEALSEDQPKSLNVVATSFTLPSNHEKLHLVDIIDGVLSESVDHDINQHQSFSNLASPSDSETKRCKSLGERKSFECDNLQSVNIDMTPPTDLSSTYIEPKISNTADMIVEKQISLLENMIEDNRINFRTSNEQFITSKLSVTEECSQNSNSSGFSLLSTKQEDGNTIAFTHNTNIITNLIKPPLHAGHLIPSTQYEEISEDSNCSNFHFEEQKSRKALNRDEELFLECCSLLKSSSDVSDLSKKTKPPLFLSNFNIKPLAPIEWLEQKPLTTRSCEFPPVQNNIEDDSSLSDHFYNDLSYSNSSSSFCYLNGNVDNEKPVNDNFFNQPAIFEDISTDSQKSIKSLANCFKDFNKCLPISTNSKTSNDDCISPMVESAQIPETDRSISIEIDNDIGVSKVLEVGISDGIKNNAENLDYNRKPLLSILQPEFDFPVSKKSKKDENKKMLTKGAMKVFEGLKVSIPKEGLDMKEVLSCSPTSKRLEIEAEQNNTTKINKKQVLNKDHKLNKTINKTEPKLNCVNKSGNKLGYKIKKKKNLTNFGQNMNYKIDENKQKNHDIYDFEETQDSIDIFPKNSNSVPVYHSFRNKIQDKTNEINESSTETTLLNTRSKHEDNDKKSTISTKSSKLVTNQNSTKNALKKININNGITKKKCMIMGRIFKNAVKPKVIDDIKSVSVIEDNKILENFVQNCHNTEVNTHNENKEQRLTSQDMDEIFNNLLKDEKLANSKVDYKSCDKVETNVSPLNHSSSVKTSEHKSKKTNNKCKKRQRLSSSGSSDEEFSIKKISKKPCNNKRNSNKTDCVINLEQELRECIGVASRKSQRKCTSGKQNVLVEHWSSDESSSDGILPKSIVEDTPKINFPLLTEDILNYEPVFCLTSNSNIEDISESSLLSFEKVLSPIIVGKDEENNSNSNVNLNSELNGELQKNVVKKKVARSEFSNRKCISEVDNLDSPPLASSRQKRSAVDTLYYWSSSSEDDVHDIIEVKPLRGACEEDDEDRPLQQGWIVGDSPKKLVTMLAQAKGKKVDLECVKKKRKKRTSV